MVFISVYWKFQAYHSGGKGDVLVQKICAISNDFGVSSGKKKNLQLLSE